MAALSATSAHATGGFIDPSKPAEYPILLGDRLASKQQPAKDSGFLNVNYNHKTKGASPHQRTVIKRGEAEDLYNLTIQDKAGNAEQTTLTYKYQGSVDPSIPATESDYNGLVLVFDPKRKAFILEPVSTSLNFNLRSAPGKTDQQVATQYPQLKTLSDEAQSSKFHGDDFGDDDELGQADESNPFDFRHFLPKEETETEKSGGISPSTSATTTTTTAAKPTPKLLNKPGPTRPKPNPLRQQKRAPKPAPAKAPKSPMPVPVEPEREIPSVESPQEEVPKRVEPAAQSPNIIVDGDLIIDMGSPPPQRRPFKINPRHFSSNNTSGNEAGYGSDDDDLEDPQLPVAFAQRAFSNQPQEEESEEEDEDEEEEDEEEDKMVENESEVQRQPEPEHEHEPEPEPEPEDEADDNDDPLAADLKAAYEQARLEEEQRARRQQYQRQQQNVVSDDESEVSEEE